MAENWLKNYYGKDFDLLNPEVVIDGKKKAVVRLTRMGSRGYSGIGFVLISKAGSHASSSHRSLHEGPASNEIVEQMRAILAKEDA